MEGTGGWWLKEQLPGVRWVWEPGGFCPDGEMCSAPIRGDDPLGASEVYLARYINAQARLLPPTIPPCGRRPGGGSAPPVCGGSS